MELHPDAGSEQPLPVIARIDSDTRTRAGDEIGLTIEPSRVLLFDADSGERLGADAG
jgi:hypothetical protein